MELSIRMLTRTAWPTPAGANQLLKISAGDEEHLAARHHLHAVIRDIEEQVLEIQRVAGNAQADDLPITVAGQLLPVGDAGPEDAALVRGIAFADRIGRRFQLPRDGRQGQDRLAVLGRQARVLFQLAEQRSLDFEMSYHDGSCTGREREHSQSPTPG